MEIDYDDGGREAAGFKGTTGDCVVRAIAIATQQPYRKVYNDLNEWAKQERGYKNIYGIRKRSNARLGVYAPTTRKYLESLGWKWTATMGIGTGCTVHLREGELPGGHIVCVLSRHLVAVVDGVVHDTGDPTREGRRCVYGFFSQGS